MTVTTASLRAAIPQLADATVYSDAMLSYWLGVASARMNTRWGTRADEALTYLAAHLAITAVMSSKSGSRGLGGMGVVASKSVGPGSVSYDNRLSYIEGAGPYNLTLWGQMYWQLAKQLGIGPIQLVPAYVGGDYNGLPIYPVWPYFP